jgi:lysophospholipase L1-like esterase
MAALKAHLQAHAVPGLARPPLMAMLPQITWAGPLSGGQTAPTTLPNGVVVPASSNLIGKPLRDRWSASLPGSPTVNGLPCLAVSRQYTCQGISRSVDSVRTLRVKTDAPVLEISGVLPENSATVQTLLVNGQLVPATALSCSRGIGGGWTAGTLRIDFGTRAMRDIWLETAMYAAFVKVDQQDTVLAPDGDSEPQITVVGDSYLQCKSTAFANTGAIALELGARLGLRKVCTDSIGGTGYQNTGSRLGNLNDRLPAHSADNSIVYLVMAGLNDYGDVPSAGQVVWSTRAEYEETVLGYARKLRQAQPNALIVITAPFCPIPPQSDSSYVAHAGTNSSGSGDFLYKAQLHKSAVQQIAGPWVYIDVLMGTGWLNSSGASGDITNLQWLTGGTPGPGTTATYKPGNTLGGGGGGFGGVASVPLLSAGKYTQAPEVRASGGSGQGLLLSSTIDASGAVTSITVLQAGYGYEAQLPTITIDPTYEITPAVPGVPVLLQGINPDGAYPLPSFAPSGATDLNNIYRYMSPDKTHPSPLGVEYLSARLARSIYDAVMAL